MPMPSVFHLPHMASIDLHRLYVAWSHMQVRCACIEQHAASPPHASPLLILFSGGIDSTLLAALAHQCLPPEVPIDLSNVCFDGGRSPDRQAARHALEVRLICMHESMR